LKSKTTKPLVRPRALVQSILPTTLTAAASTLGLASGPVLLAVAAPATGVSPWVTREGPVDHDEEFIHYLFQRGGIEFDEVCVRLAATGKMFARKTHRLSMRDGEPTLERISFDCGFD